jgi:DNA (cytosine-5)-methyltransferase 1
MILRPKKLVADLMCGAGGSSEGARLAFEKLGYEMVLKVLNHWQRSIDTHSVNHPQAEHYCQDIATVRPHMVVREGYLDLMMASPSCVFHSVARGGKPTSDQQRSDPWHIIAWLTELEVRNAIIENVWEFTKWTAVDPDTGRPVKSREGEYFRAWLDIWHRLGFTTEFKKLNSANYGGATTRLRFIMKACRDRRMVAWAPLTHSKNAAVAGTKRWRPAREIIDWSIKGKSIFARPVPLAPKTLVRILAGARKFGWHPGFIAVLAPEIERSCLYVVRKSFSQRHAGKADVRRARRARVRQYAGWLRHMRGKAVRPWAARSGTAPPIVVTLRKNADGRSIEMPAPAVAANGTHIALAEPVVVNMKGRSTASNIDNPSPTQTAHTSHLYVAEPVIMNGRKNNQAKPVSAAPVPTLDTKGGVWLAEPFVVTVAHGNSARENSPDERRCRSADDPLQTIHAGGGKFAVAEPFVLATGSTGAPRAVEEPIPTATTGGAGSDDPGCARPMLVEPFILSRHGEGHGETRAHSIDDPAPTASCSGAGYVVEPFVLSQASGGAARAVSEPIPTATAGGAGGSHALISPYYGTGSGETCSTVESPLPTATGTARFGLVIPITHNDASNRARDVDVEPLPTLTAANRGELAFITAQFGEREGQAARVHDIAQPVPGICATGHVNLVEPEIDAGLKFDILFRMFETHELAAAMGFHRGRKYQFTGTKTEQIKQIGNAVSVEMMEAEVAALFDPAEPVMMEAAE